MKYKDFQRGQKQLRKGRFSNRGCLYFITTSCFNRQRIFIEKNVVQIVFDTIDWLENKGYIDCYFVILMPDHMHLIFQLLGEKTLSEVMKSLKGYTGRKIKEYLRLETKVWQEQYYDHQIRKNEDFIEIMKYCLYNPVRAGLVETPFDYPFWKSKYKFEI